MELLNSRDGIVSLGKKATKKILETHVLFHCQDLQL